MQKLKMIFCLFIFMLVFSTGIYADDSKCGNTPQR